MAAVDSDFDSWLNFKLRALNTDEGVFCSYIKGILEGEETIEDKTEALEEILSEIVASDDIPNHCREILEKWQMFFQAAKPPPNASGGGEEMDVKLARLLESQARPTAVQRTTYTEEERKIREAILAQYSQMSDHEDEGDDVPKERAIETKENGLVKNTNVAVVQQAEKEKREKAKQDSKQKKEKDREDREKQKQQQQDKKEKRKTQKGERRR